MTSQKITKALPFGEKRGTDYVNYDRLPDYPVVKRTKERLGGLPALLITFSTNNL